MNGFFKDHLVFDKERRGDAEVARVVLIVKVYATFLAQWCGQLRDATSLEGAVLQIQHAICCKLQAGSGELGRGVYDGLLSDAVHPVSVVPSPTGQTYSGGG